MTEQEIRDRLLVESNKKPTSNMLPDGIRAKKGMPGPIKGLQGPQLTHEAAPIQQAPQVRRMDPNLPQGMFSATGVAAETPAAPASPTSYLDDLAELERKQKQLEYEDARDRALRGIEYEQGKLAPLYQGQREQANIASQIGAKNLAEFWASRGQTSSGLSSQAELSRQNVLGRSISGIDKAESDANLDFANQRTNINAEFESGLRNEMGNIDIRNRRDIISENQRLSDIAREDARYQEGLKQYEEQKAFEQEKWKEQLKQQQFENNLALNKYRASLAPVSGGTPEGSFRVLNGTPQTYQNGKWTDVKYQTDKVTGEILNKKTYEWNKKGYQLTSEQSPLTYKDSNGKTKNYAVWYKGNDPYIIANENPIYIGTDKNKMIQSFASSSLSDTKIKRLLSELGVK